MVYKPALMKSRGSAGESAMSPRRGYNFSNMYAINKTDEARNEVKGIGQQLEGAQIKTGNLAQMGQQAARRGQDPGQYTNQIAQQVDKARGLSQVANSYNVGANAMKNGGQSGYQAGITSFYAGGQGAQDQARKFSGIYDQVRNSAGIYNSGIGTIYAQGKKDVEDSRLKAEGRAREAANKKHEENLGIQQNVLDNQTRDANRPDGVQNMSNIDWMYKTGRITSEEYYRAQKDKAFYDTLIGRYS